MGRGRWKHSRPWRKPQPIHQRGEHIGGNIAIHSQLVQILPARQRQHTGFHRLPCVAHAACPPPHRSHTTPGRHGPVPGAIRCRFETGQCGQLPRLGCRRSVQPFWQPQHRQRKRGLPHLATGHVKRDVFALHGHLALGLVWFAWQQSQQCCVPHANLTPVEYRAACQQPTRTCGTQPQAPAPSKVTTHHSLLCHTGRRTRP